MILLNKLFGMVSNFFSFLLSFSRMPFEISFFALTLLCPDFFSIERKARLLRCLASLLSFSLEITDRDCVYFIRFEQKSNRYDRYLAFILLFFLFFLHFFVYALIFFLCKISTSCFLLWIHRTFLSFSLFLLLKKGLWIRFGKCVMCVCVWSPSIQWNCCLSFFLYINSHSCNSRRNPFITSRRPDKNSFRKYFRFLSFFLFLSSAALADFFFYWFSSVCPLRTLPKISIIKYFFSYACRYQVT